MADSAISIADQFHVITRRLFEADLRRHFVGRVIGVGPPSELVGHAFVFDRSTNDYERRSGERSRLFDLGHPNLIVNRIPAEVDLGDLDYRVENARLVLTDGKNFSLDINEFGTNR